MQFWLHTGGARGFSTAFSYDELLNSRIFRSTQEMHLNASRAFMFRVAHFALMSPSHCGTTLIPAPTASPVGAATHPSSGVHEYHANVASRLSGRRGIRTRSSRETRGDP